MSRIVDTDSPKVIKAYEQRIERLEADKLILLETAQTIGQPKRPFDETFRTAFDFLANPCFLWHSEHMEDTRMVLKLAFAAQVSYTKRDGFRTVQPSQLFELFQSLKETASNDIDRDEVMAHRGRQDPEIISLYISYT